MAQSRAVRLVVGRELVADGSRVRVEGVGAGVGVVSEEWERVWSGRRTMRVEYGRR